MVVAGLGIEQGEVEATGEERLLVQVVQVEGARVVLDVAAQELAPDGGAIVTTKGALLRAEGSAA